MNRFALASEGSIWLFTVSAVVGSINLIRLGGWSFNSFVLVTGVPALSSLLLLFLGAFVLRSLLAVGRIAFPLNVTLPLAHCSIMFAALNLMQRGYGEVLRVPTQIQIASLWARPDFYLPCVALQIALLTVIAIPARQQKNGLA